MRLVLTVVVLALAAGPAWCGDPPTPAPAPAPPTAPPPPPPPGPARAKPKPTRIDVPKVQGVQWEGDFDAGMARAVEQGRPVFLAVHADEGQPGGSFPSEAYGVASEPFVCFVANPADHGSKTLPDGTRVCSRYLTGTCAAHKAALAYALRRLSTDGLTLVSPSHAILEPDGDVASFGEYAQSAPTPRDLDRWFVRISPRRAMRRAWTSRADRMETLGKTPTADLEKAAAAWLAERDELAPAGVGSLLDEAQDPARRDALLAALATAGARAAPVVFDAVDSATSNPDADVDAALRWTRFAISIDPELGGFAAARVLARAKDATARARLAGAGLEEAAAKRTRASDPTGGDAPIAERIASPSRAVRRAALLRATAADVAANAPAVKKALSDPWEEVRVAAALALRRAGDASGADVVLRAFGDPIEGPETRAALVAMAGQDLGEDVGPWAEWVRATKEAGR